MSYFVVRTRSFTGATTTPSIDSDSHNLSSPASSQSKSAWTITIERRQVMTTPSGQTPVPIGSGSLGEALDCLEKDQEFLLKGNVFTSDFLEMWIGVKGEEHDALLPAHNYVIESYGRLSIDCAPFVARL